MQWLILGFLIARRESAEHPPALSATAGGGGAGAGACRGPGIARAVLARGTDYGELQGVTRAAARRAGNGLGLAKKQLLKRIFAFFANVFIDRHKELPASKTFSIKYFRQQTISGNKNFG